MDISNPRRILAVSLEGSESHLSRVLKGNLLYYAFPFMCFMLYSLGGCVFY